MARVPIKMEFLFKASPNIIHKFLTMPDCIIRWFCDECRVVDDYYVFGWEGNEEIALLVDDFEEELVRFHWDDSPDNELLEFKISTQEVTNETVVELVAFADADEVEEEKSYWNIQMENLRRATGT